MAPRPKSARSTRADANEPKKPARVRLSTEERRTQLLELGIRTFSERPYDEVSIDDVAHEAGISKGLLYHYFPTKRHYYVETVREVARRLLASTETDPTRDPLAQLMEGLASYFEFVEEHGAVYAGLVRSGIGADPEVLRIIDATRQELLGRMLEGSGQANPPPLARTALRGWIGFVEATSLDWVERRDVEKEKLIGLWVAVLADALPRILGPGVLPE